tara:strand:+ start:629 stop:883 length:255 start_codon:yes stop_codon:yes gene_type:complete
LLIIRLNKVFTKGLVLAMKIQDEAKKNTCGRSTATGAGIGTLIGVIAGVAFDILPFLGVFIGVGAGMGIAYCAAQTGIKNKEDR